MTSPSRITATPTPACTELRLLTGADVLPVAAWAFSGHRAMALCQRLVSEDKAVEGDDLLLVEHAAIAQLTAAQAHLLDLPPLTTLRAVVEGSGIMARPDFHVALRWTRPGGQNVLGVSRTGAWLQEADGWRRLPETLFGVAEAVQRHAAVPQGDEAARLRALAALREALPHAATAGNAEASGVLGVVTIVEADALSLETMGDGDAMQLVPVLHRAGGGGPLLPEDRQRQFGAQQFHRWPTARAVYTLPGGLYVTLSPPLRQALEVVRRAAASPLAQRRAFLREPRAAIREAIGDEAELVLDALVIETPEWAERVRGLGLWKPRVVPWIALSGNDWFVMSPSGSPSEAQAPTAPRGIMVGDEPVPLTPESAAALDTRVEAAISAGADSVIHRTERGDVEIPATAATRSVLALLIKPNEALREIEAAVVRRPTPPRGAPSCLHTPLKPHQAEGLDWLQASWAVGAPGVLLADDMGLGKTLQGLAFLAWLREGMAAGKVPGLPVLIVAPTGLLDNWRAEHDRHLVAPGLGTVLLAYGKGLAILRRRDTDGATRLDRAALQTADWVLTTYETLRDHDQDFGAVRFAAVLLDEAQKVKTPGIRLTDAAKAMNADFRIALTGTPVENRLADLWCIVDGVAPGHLGDLKRFSATYEAEPNAERLASLKASLDQPIGGRPPLLLRRLRQDRLPDLPSHQEKLLRGPMQASQLLAYEDALALGRAERRAGQVLEALQRLRAVSLHPTPDCDDDDALIAGSARLGLAIGALDAIASQGERALVFLDNLDLMARLAGLLQRRYKLANTPMIINGRIAGAGRQSRVDRFQEGPAGFDVMLLSPRAGGVGLTLTRANHVIHLARWWNPAVEDQCTGRVLRIGQQRPVTIHVPMAVLPDGRRSFDDNLHALLSRKRQLMRDALWPPDADAGELAAILDDSIAG